MKLFITIHLILWLIWSFIVVSAGSVWSGFTSSYIHMIVPFVLAYSHIQVIPFSVFAFLLIYFLKSTLSIKIKRK